MTGLARPMSDVYYDPFDFEIDTDPHPTFRGLRTEVPLYTSISGDSLQSRDTKMTTLTWLVRLQSLAEIEERIGALSLLCRQLD